MRISSNRPCYDDLITEGWHLLASCTVWAQWSRNEALASTDEVSWTSFVLPEIIVHFIPSQGWKTKGKHLGLSQEDWFPVKTWTYRSSNVRLLNLVEFGYRPWHAKLQLLSWHNLLSFVIDNFIFFKGGVLVISIVCNTFFGGALWEICWIPPLGLDTNSVSKCFPSPSPLPGSSHLGHILPNFLFGITRRLPEILSESHLKSSILEFWVGYHSQAISILSIYLLWAPYPLKPSLKSPGWKSVESSTSPSSMPPFPVIQANAEKEKKNCLSLKPNWHTRNQKVSYNYFETIPYCLMWMACPANAVLISSFYNIDNLDNIVKPGHCPTAPFTTLWKLLFIYYL